ncbi:hypothetical protein MVES1_002240 [Malassezia vespertilionis]|uniref:Uncharacterized protein n=1 Tax=Malassezia vespertilionis TaxID=2020962 RepID=A0A2N1JC09_9BASI|nr:uncharacterized protein MVES1_002240 [Malassezia vespertilionis]PKI84062.1 hypothetical protein MVES_002114 [Malassezia vespertilionis]WFD06885.1 hypothetical protein MVES1_002240 [Malassezia vespertilionis]
MDAGAPQRVFQAVKPLCVTLLQHTSAPQVSVEIPNVLCTLAGVLKREHTTPFTPSLIHYIFYPISQLLRMRDGLFGLPDRVRELIFVILGELVQDWWHAWTWASVGAQAPPNPTLEQVQAWKVWEQLLLLGTMALSGGGAHVPNSAETLVAIMQFLACALAPRAAPRKPQEEEWDGESELPDLEAIDDGECIVSTQVYPPAQLVCAVHESRVALGALTHVVKIALDTASNPKIMTVLRCAALELATVLAIPWIAGDRHIVSSGPCIDAESCIAYYRAKGYVGEKERSAALLTPILPGMASALIRCVDGPRGARSVPALVLMRALPLLAAILVVCVGDVVTQSFRVPEEAQSLPTRLEDFGVQEEETMAIEEAASALTVEESQVALEMDLPSHLDSSLSPTVEPLQDSTPATPSTPRPSTPPRDAAWLQRTMQPVLLSLFALGPVRGHEHPDVQYALIAMAHMLLALVPQTLAYAWIHVTGRAPTHNPIQHILCLLLDTASDAHPVDVCNNARQAIADIVSTEPPEWLARLDTALRNAQDRLPTAVRGTHDEETQLLARRIATLASLLSTTLAQDQLRHLSLGMLAQFSPHGGVDLWGRAFAHALGACPSMEAMPIDASTASSLTLKTDLEHGTQQCIFEMARACGAAIARLLVGIAQSECVPQYQHVFHAPLYFLTQGEAQPRRDAYAAHFAVACFFSVHALVQGAADVLATTQLETYTARHGKRALRKCVHTFARHCVQVIVQVWTDDVEEEHEIVPPERALVAAPDDAPHMVKGLDAPHETGALVKPRVPVDTTVVDSVRLHASGTAPQAAQFVRAQQRLDGMHALGDAFLLSLLGSAASLLGASFRPLLLKTLYPVLSALKSSEMTVRVMAGYTLQRIADACAYPTVQSLVLHHADYVLGAASHRLVSGLSTELRAGIAQMQLAKAMHSVDAQLPSTLLGARSAPWVLVQVMQMVGPEVLPLVEDAVDEVLDALDRFHGYSEVSDGLLAVLARILDMLAFEKSPQAPAANTARNPSAPELLASFAFWLEHDRAVPSDTPVPHDDQEHAPASTDEELNPPSTRLQSVVTQMVLRCIPFLSHGAPTIRVHALVMLEKGVQLLAAQGRTAELYPILHAAWPLLMARLGVRVTQNPSRLRVRRTDSSAAILRDATPSEQDANVWMHATTTLGTMGRFSADVFAKPILQQAWPRWARLLYVLDQLTAQPRPAIKSDTLAPNAAAFGSSVRIVDTHATYGQVLLCIVHRDASRPT